MKVLPAQNLLVALHGKARVTIGLDTPETLRQISDARSLTCPGCGGIVVLHAGTVRAHHFAHLPGAVCSLPTSEPETEEHRAGKLLIAEWLRECLPDAEVLIEAFLPATGQRADVLVVLPDRSRIALEYQCAQLSAREWRRRNRQYREVGFQDLWILGGSRLITTAAEPKIVLHEGDEKRQGKTVALRTTELERTLLSDGAPLLFVDSVGEHMPIGTLVRFRPEAEAQAHRPQGQLVRRALLSLPFPFHLLDWPSRSHPDAPGVASAIVPPATNASTTASDFWVWQWLAQRYQVTPETLSAFFGLKLTGEEAFSCGSIAWQAAIYYRFIHRCIGDGWWLGEVEAWTRHYLPIARTVRPSRLRTALSDYQEALAAAGMLSLPMGYGRTNARILADLTTLPTSPDRAEVLRIVRYRRTLARENAASYNSR